MNSEQLEILVKNTFDSCRNLMCVKGAEYAGKEDRLANFKRGAQITGNTPLQVALIYASKHWDSICTFVRNDAAGFQQILSEPIDGRLDDLINYCLLIKAIIREGEGGLPQQTECGDKAPVMRDSCFDSDEGL